MKTNNRTQNYLARWEHFLPEILSLALLLFANSPFNTDALAYPILIRASIVGSIAIHGLGHVLVAGGAIGHTFSPTPHGCV